MAPLVISAADRESFKRCRREWDLGSRMRQGYEPLARKREPSPNMARCLFDALAIYYYPGMWEWDRTIVKPLVVKAWEQSVDTHCARDDANHWRPRGEEIFDRYFEWAPAVDNFWPLRVETDFAVNIPDPVLADRDLATDDGRELRYEGRADLVAVDDEYRFWIVEHRNGWTDLELLELDEAAITKCWAWGHFHLREDIAGTIFNEVRLDDDGTARFRRTVIPRSSKSLELARRQLGREVLLMIDESLVPFPSPSGLHCAECAYRPPCIAMSAGADPAAILDEHYRRRDPDEPVEGRLGGPTWSIGRGARPQHFDARDAS